MFNVSSNVNMKDYKTENTANPTSENDAINKTYVDAIANNILTGIDTLTGDSNRSNNKIANLAMPTNNTDATNKT